MTWLSKLTSDILQVSQHPYFTWRKIKPTNFIKNESGF